MRSRTSRLFGGPASAPKTLKPAASATPQLGGGARPPSRTLTLLSPTFAPDYDSRVPDFTDSFGDFDFGVEKLADSLCHHDAHPSDELLQYYVDSSEEPSPSTARASSSFRSSMASVNPKAHGHSMGGIEEEAEEEVEGQDFEAGADEGYEQDLESTHLDGDALSSSSARDDVSLRESVAEGVDDGPDSDYQLFLTATRISLFSAGKPRLVNVVHRRTASNSSTSTSVSAYSTRSNSYSVDDDAGSAASAASSLSDLDGVAPAPAYVPAKALANPKPFARRGVPQRPFATSPLGRVEELAGGDAAAPNFSRGGKGEARKANYPAGPIERKAVPHARRASTERRGFVDLFKY